MREVGGGGGTLPGRPPMTGRGGTEGLREGPRRGGGPEERVWDGRPGAVGAERGAGVGAAGVGVSGVDAIGCGVSGFGTPVMGRMCVGAAARSVLGAPAIGLGAPAIGLGSELLRIFTVALR